MDLKSLQVRALRHQVPIRIESISVEMSDAVGPRHERTVTVKISPAPPSWALNAEIQDDMLVVDFKCHGTMGQYVLYPGLRLIRGLNLKEQKAHSGYGRWRKGRWE